MGAQLVSVAAVHPAADQQKAAQLEIANIVGALTAVSLHAASDDARHFLARTSEEHRSTSILTRACCISTGLVAFDSSSIFLSRRCFCSARTKSPVLKRANKWIRLRVASGEARLGQELSSKIKTSQTRTISSKQGAAIRADLPANQTCAI